MVALNYGAFRERNLDDNSNESYGGIRRPMNTGSYEGTQWIKGRDRLDRLGSPATDINMRIYSMDSGRAVGDYARANESEGIYKILRTGGGAYTSPTGATPMFPAGMKSVSAGGMFANFGEGGDSGN